MDIQVNHKTVRRIILLERDESGSMIPQTLWKPKKSKKKGRKELRQVDRAIRKAGKAQRTFGDTLLKRHRGSNKRKKDGGVKDLGKNIIRASRKSIKRIAS